ncbi:MAG: hypothetical protein HUK20_13225 [Fibrobacter sp.]|nr:hypothetical protein [Fibrobacter sp.]
MNEALQYYIAERMDDISMLIVVCILCTIFALFAGVFLIMGEADERGGMNRKHLNILLTLVVLLVLEFIALTLLPSTEEAREIIKLLKS